MKSLLPVLATLSSLFLGNQAIAQDIFEYRLLATNKTSTMEEELNEASEAGFRLQTVMGGETAFGGDEAVAIMSRLTGEDDAGRYHYRLLATSRTSTMEEELQEAGDAGYVYVGQTVFSSLFVSGKPSTSSRSPA